MFLSCGDSLYDMFLQPAENLQVKVNGVAGGSPMNVAVGVARLGHDSAYLTKLSADVFGEGLKQYLHDNSVDTSLCLPTERNTTLAFINKQPDGSARYSFYIDGTADVSVSIDELPAVLPDKVTGLHFGSYSTAVGAVAGALKSLAARESKTRFISYDPNLRLAIEPDLDKWRESFAAFAKTATLIKASDEDIEALTGANAEERFVADCFSHGAQIVYVTRGASGASVYLPDGESHNAASESVEAVDTVGAGDTFQAAIVHWMIDRHHISPAGELTGSIDAEASLKFALHAAAITCSRFGADLPRLADL